MNNDNGFPKFQWSKFKGPAREEQYVIRADDLEELFMAIEALKLRINEGKDIDEALEEVAVSKKICSVCNEQMTYRTGVSKVGKKWAGWFCQDKSHSPEWVKI